MESNWRTLKNIYQHLSQMIRSRPRLMIGLIVGLVVGFFLPIEIVQNSTIRWIVGWNSGAILYLLLATHILLMTHEQHVHRRALDQYVGRWLVLIFVILSAIICLGSIVSLLSSAKNLHGILKLEHIVLAGLTVISSWLFTQVMFAQHYAHDYYYAKHHGMNAGLLFPGEEKPTYSDFIYFSCIIGTSAQTADVSVASVAMRRTVLLHCIFAFFFNTTLIALTINIASGLI